MRALTDQIQRVWPKANWAVGRREGKWFGYINNGAMIGSKRWADGWENGASPEDALDKAFRLAMRIDYAKSEPN